MDGIRISFCFMKLNLFFASQVSKKNIMFDLKRKLKYIPALPVRYAAVFASLNFATSTLLYERNVFCASIE